MCLRVLVLLLVVGLGAGCSDDGPRDSVPSSQSPSSEVPAELSLPPDAAPSDPRQALALIPDDATEVTLTDFRRIRARLGYRGLTSDSLMTDRIAFWERVRTEIPMLSEGLLRADASELWLDFGLGQDDVVWEARFRTSDGPGWVVAFRKGQPMAEVRSAVRAGAGQLRGSRVWDDERLLVKGIATDDEQVLASRADVLDLLGAEAESTYLRTSCVPLREALGDEATVDDQSALLAAQDIRYLRPLAAFAVSFTDGVVTARLGVGRNDLHQRADLVDVWPETGSVNWADGFRGLTVADPATGRIGTQLRNTVAAVRLTLSGRLPYAVCNEVVPMEEPTGL